MCYFTIILNKEKQQILTFEKLEPMFVGQMQNLRFVHTYKLKQCDIYFVQNLAWARSITLLHNLCDVIKSKNT